MGPWKIFLKKGEFVCRIVSGIFTSGAVGFKVLSSSAEMTESVTSVASTIAESEAFDQSLKPKKKDKKKDGKTDGEAPAEVENQA